jgi:hypothetical protein
MRAEEHLLACASCQSTLESVDMIIQSMRIEAVSMTTFGSTAFSPSTPDSGELLLLQLFRQYLLHSPY